MACESSSSALCGFVASVFRCIGYCSYLFTFIGCCVTLERRARQHHAEDCTKLSDSTCSVRGKAKETAQLNLDAGKIQRSWEIDDF